MSPLDKLTAYFERFPGVGARQARRYAFHILTLSEHETTELATAIQNLRSSVQRCRSCQRFFTQASASHDHCSICTDPNRDRQTLLIVSHDNDITAIERSGTYTGLYFVLGGTVPLLHEPNATQLRSGALKQSVQQRITDDELQEIILGFPINPDGENTGRFVTHILDPIITDTTIRIAELGRGLSTGSELEYADSETIKNALRNRH